MRIWRVVSVFLLVIALAAVLSLSGAPHDPKEWTVPEAARKMKNPVPRTDAALAAAKAIFIEQCSNCHGEAGKGDGPDAMMYNPEPADLTDARMMGEMSDGEIFYKVTEGRKPMPSFKEKLSAEQRWQLVHFVRTFTGDAKPAPAAPAKKSAAKKSPGQ